MTDYLGTTGREALVITARSMRLTARERAALRLPMALATGWTPKQVRDLLNPTQRRAR